MNDSCHQLLSGTTLANEQARYLRVLNAVLADDQPEIEDLNRALLLVAALRTTQTRGRAGGSERLRLLWTVLLPVATGQHFYVDRVLEGVA